MSAAPPTYTNAEYLARWSEIEAISAQLEGPSLADRLALCELDEPGTTGKLLDQLGPQQTLMLAYDWQFWGRPKQLAAVATSAAILLFIAGRGNGKTRTAVEWLIARLLAGARDLALIGPTDGEIEQFMLGGYKKRIDAANGSGLFDCLPPWIRYEYNKNKGIIEFPDFKAVARTHSAEDREYRGPAPDSVWGDEPIKWRYPEALLDNVMMANRDVGKVPPRLFLTTSPKKLRFLRDLVMSPDVHTIHGETNENRGNVDEAWYQRQLRRLGGTSKGLEELRGILGVDEDGSIFAFGLIDQHRELGGSPPLDRIVVAVDPGGSQHRKADPSGIVALGRAGDIHTGHGYVLADKTAQHTWDGWGEVSVKLAEEIGASAIVLERNKFADAVAANIRTAGARLGWTSEPRPGFKSLVDLVKHGRRIQIVEVLAMGDKASRAGPVSTLYQAGRMHHVGHLTRLESEMSEWDPATGLSPNGMDALVHGATELFALDRAPEISGAESMQGMAEAGERLAAAARQASSGGSWLSAGRSGRRPLSIR